MANSSYSVAFFDEEMLGRIDTKYLSYKKELSNLYDENIDYDTLGKYIMEVKNPVKFKDGVIYKFYDTSIKSVNEKGQFVNYQLITKQTAPSRAKQMAIKDTIIVANLKTNKGKACIVTEKEDGSIVSSGYLMIKPTNKMNIEYLQQILQCEFSLYYLRQIASTGLGMSNWSFSDLCKIKLKVPSLEEQERTLPLVKEKIKIIEDKIKELEVEKKANDFNHLLDKYLGDMLGIKIPSINDFSNSIITTRNFDDIVEKLSIDANMGDFSYLKNSKYDITNINKLYKKGIITKIQDGSHLLSPKNNDLDDNGYYYIQCGNLTPNGFTLSSLKRVTKNFYDNVGQGYVEENDVLLSVMGTVGISCVLKKKIDGVINVAIMFIRTNTKYINPQYLSYWLNSIFFNYQIMIDKTNMSRDQISAKKLLRSKIILPDKETQDKIVEQLEELLTYNPYWDNKIKELQSIIDNDLNKYILNGYSDDLFEIPKGE